VQWLYHIVGVLIYQDLLGGISLDLSICPATFHKEVEQGLKHQKYLQLSVMEILKYFFQ